MPLDVNAHSFSPQQDNKVDASDIISGLQRKVEEQSKQLEALVIENHAQREETQALKATLRELQHVQLQKDTACLQMDKANPALFLCEPFPESINSYLRDERMNKLVSGTIDFLLPSKRSESRRLSVVSFLKCLVRKSLGAQIFPHGCFALKTYLPDGPVDVSAFFSRAHENTWVQRIVNALCQEANASEGENKASHFAVHQVSVSFEDTCVVRCKIGGTKINIFSNHTNALAGLALFECVDLHVGRAHLFKRSLLLSEAWSRRVGIIGPTQLDHLFISTAMLYVFNAYHAAILSPLDALFKLLVYLQNFDWDNLALSILGPIKLSSLNSSKLETMLEGPSAWPTHAAPLITNSTIRKYMVPTVAKPPLQQRGGSRSRSSLSRPCSANSVSSLRTPSSTNLSSLVLNDHFTTARERTHVNEQHSPARRSSCSLSRASLSRVYSRAGGPLGELGDNDLDEGEYIETGQGEDGEDRQEEPEEGGQAPEISVSENEERGPYTRCGLNVLDPIDPLHNLGARVNYKDEFRIRRTLVHGASELAKALEKAANASGTSKEAVLDSPFLCVLFEEAYLFKYQEHYRRQTYIESLSSTCTSTHCVATDSPATPPIPVTPPIPATPGKPPPINPTTDPITTPAANPHPGIKLPPNPAPSPSTWPTLVLPTTAVAMPKTAVVLPSQNASSLADSATTAHPAATTTCTSTSTSTPTTRATTATITPPSSGPPSPLASSNSAAGTLPTTASTSTATVKKPQPMSQCWVAGAAKPRQECSYDVLDGNLERIVQDLKHARQFQTPLISEEELVDLIIKILRERGSAPVGRMGSLLHDATNNHSLPAMLKEHYGGLKRLLERHRHIFTVGKDHPYNPHVTLHAGVASPRESIASNSSTTSSANSSHYSSPRSSLRRGSSSASNFITAEGQPDEESGKRRRRVRKSRPSSQKRGTNPRDVLTNCLAMDCEMVGVGPSGVQSMLARCSIVNFRGAVIYDKHVKPTQKITDYRTHVSGISKEDVERATADFKQVQRQVANLLKNRLLVGHSITADLQALLLTHPKRLIRDTAHYKGLCPQRPLSLKHLCKEHLGMDIQTGQHDSVEDARSALALYKSMRHKWEKMQNPPEFRRSARNPKYNSSHSEPTAHRAGHRISGGLRTHDR